MAEKWPKRLTILENIQRNKKTATANIQFLASSLAINLHEGPGLLLDFSCLFVLIKSIKGSFLKLKAQKCSRHLNGQTKFQEAFEK